jgi:hypothetical protein
VPEPLQGWFLLLVVILLLGFGPYDRPRLCSLRCIDGAATGAVWVGNRGGRGRCESEAGTARVVGERGWSCVAMVGSGGF